MSAIPHLQKQLKDLQRHPLGGFRIEVADDIHEWTVWFAGPKDTPYHPGVYKALMKFPPEFPFKPPQMRIVSKFWHPNVYEDGNVCISVLHPPGVDEQNSIETAQMRWTPIQTIEKVLVAVVSLLSDPDAADAGAPANVDALVQFRKDRGGYNRRCQQLAKKALEDLPPEFVPPPEEDAPPELNSRGMSAFAADSQGFFGDDGGESDDAQAEQAQTRPYEAELQSVREMGVGEDRSDEDILAVLAACKGDLERAIDRLS